MVRGLGCRVQWQRLHGDDLNSSPANVLFNYKLRVPDVESEEKCEESLVFYSCDPPWLGHRGGITFRVDLPVATRRSDPPAVRREAALRAIAELPHPDVTIWSDGSARGGLNRAAHALIQFHHLNREETVRAPAGAVCSSLSAELTAMREAFAAVAGLEDGELASTKSVRLLTDSRSGLQLLGRGPANQTMALAAEVWRLLSAEHPRRERHRDGAPRATAAHPHPDPTPGHNSLALGSVTLSQLRTGTSPLTRDTLHKIGPEADDECPACGEPDSAAHLLTDCPAYEAARRRRWGVDPRLVDVLGGPATKVVTFIEDVGRTEPPLDPPAPPPPERVGGGMQKKKKKQLPARHGGEAEFRRWTARAMASTDKRQLNHNTYNYVIVMMAVLSPAVALAAGSAAESVTAESAAETAAE
ncbi:hypothetical protein FJT64_021552 [Amphibalanus amphitrite]|uniref:Uncharacterized protein n=1 Tax=Amphibalanus amphitrite TaxID=1232801 RepID=A0A6A4WHU3_AMPAM|nr:hypothetical protein FJT64_021552 [Amphibalanus amphitrite]